jgi:hypothetical protein
MPGVISKEPLAPVVRKGDDKWFDIVSWIEYAQMSVTPPRCGTPTSPRWAFRAASMPCGTRVAWNTPRRCSDRRATAKVRSGRPPSAAAFLSLRFYVAFVLALTPRHDAQFDACGTLSRFALNDCVTE